MPGLHLMNMANNYCRMKICLPLNKSNKSNKRDNFNEFSK